MSLIKLQILWEMDLLRNGANISGHFLEDVERMTSMEYECFSSIPRATECDGQKNKRIRDEVKVCFGEAANISCRRDLRNAALKDRTRRWRCGKKDAIRD